MWASAVVSQRLHGLRYFLRTGNTLQDLLERLFPVVYKIQVGAGSFPRSVMVYLLGIWDFLFLNDSLNDSLTHSMTHSLALLITHLMIH